TSPNDFPLESSIPAASLDSILCTEELRHRPWRPPDYEKENGALVALLSALLHSPSNILQILAETILDLIQCDSSGLSLLTKDDGGKRFYWPAIAGMWKPHIGGGTPRDFGPCGDVLDRDAPLLFRHFELRYSYFLPVTPPVEECLLVPFYCDGKAVGTIWAIAHNSLRKFDAEDKRQLVSLGCFASSAYRVVAFLDALEQQRETLLQNDSSLAQSVITIREANVQAQDSRRAALNLMEDAVRSRHAMEMLNVELRQLNETLLSMLSTIPDIVVVIGAEGEIKFKNAAAEHFIGTARVNEGLPSPIEIELRRGLGKGGALRPAGRDIAHQF